MRADDLSVERAAVAATELSLARCAELLLAAYLSAHRTVTNGSALCAALTVTERG